MNTYLFLMLFILLCSLLIENRKKFLLIACIAMFVLYGFRKATLIGIDSSSSYYYGFLKSGNITYGSIEGMNIGFQYFTKFFYHISGGNYQLYIIVIAAFVMFSFYRLLHKYSHNPLLSIMWYFGMLYYVFMFSALKQSIAMAILIFAFDALMERKPFKFVAFVLVAALFHDPALIFLPAYWITKIKIGRNYIILVVVALILTYVFRNQILTIMNNYYYEDAELTADNVKFLGGKVIYMLLIIAAAIILKVPKEDDRLYSILLIFSGIAVVFQTFCYYGNVFERLADYYYQFSVLLIPLIFENRKECNNLIGMSPNNIEVVNNIGSLVIIVFSIWRFNTYICGDYSKFFLPFRFFWE